MMPENDIDILKWIIHRTTTSRPIKLEELKLRKFKAENNKNPVY
jgi:hypothetical protein